MPPIDLYSDHRKRVRDHDWARVHIEGDRGPIINWWNSRRRKTGDGTRTNKGHGNDR